MILVTRVPREGNNYSFKMAVNPRNVVEITPKGENESWMKFWDGAELRTCIIKETPEEVVSASC